MRREPEKKRPVETRKKRNLRIRNDILPISPYNGGNCNVFLPRNVFKVKRRQNTLGVVLLNEYPLLNCYFVFSTIEPFNNSTTAPLFSSCVHNYNDSTIRRTRRASFARHLLYISLKKGAQRASFGRQETAHLPRRGRDRTKSSYRTRNEPHFS